MLYWLYDSKNESTIKAGNFMYELDTKRGCAYVVGMNVIVYPDEICKIAYDEDESNNHLLMRSWVKGPDGKEYPVTEMRCCVDWDILGDNFFGIDFSKNLKMIKKGDREECYFCGEMVIPESVFYIGSNAFQYSEFDRVVISRNVTYIGENAFVRTKEIICLSPFLERIPGTNDFRRKEFIDQENGIRYRVFGDPLNKQVEAVGILEDTDKKEYIIKDSIMIMGEKYKVGYCCDSVLYSDHRIVFDSDLNDFPDLLPDEDDENVLVEDNGRYRYYSDSYSIK